MKRFFNFLFVVAAVVGMASCNHKELDDTGEVLQFSSVPIEIGQADGSEILGSGTRSQITIDSENFVCAYLFAFDATTKKILSYPTEWEDHQGEQGGPVAKYTESKTFNWALPLNKNFDVWVIVNPGDNIQPLLDFHLFNSNLEEDDLYDSSLVFTCESSSALKDLDVATGGTGIPMAGQMNNQRLTSVNDGLTVTVKRLFAKYNIRFDASAYEDEGYTVNMFSIRGSKSNTEVPFFYDGNFAQTDRSKMNVLDYGTSNDLVELNNGEYVTLYFLENCQGTKSGVTDWNTVYQDLNESDPSLDLCSYIEVAVNVTRPAGVGYSATDESFTHRIYVGETFLNKTAHTYNFDVKRNLFQSVKIYLKTSPDIKPNAVKSFVFTNTNSLSVEPGEDITIPWVSNGFDPSELTFDSSSSELTVFTSNTTGGAVTINNIDYAYSGTVTYRAAANATNGLNVTVTGGQKVDGVYEAKDTENILISEPIILRTLEISGNTYLRSTKLTTQLAANLCTYQDGVKISSTPVTSGVTWRGTSGSVSYDPDNRKMCNVSSQGVVSYSYTLNNYETTPNMYFPVYCSYNDNGNTLTATTVVEYGETHFIKVWRILKDSNDNDLKCPYAILSEPAPTLFSAPGHPGEIVVYSNGPDSNGNWNGASITNSGCPYYWQVYAGQTTWSGAGSSTEGPNFRYASENEVYRINTATFNTTGNPTEYYDSSNKIQYYIVVQNSHDISETNTTPSSYSIILFPVTEPSGQFMMFTQEYYLAIRTNHEDKYEIPLRKMDFGQTQVWFGGNTYADIEDVIQCIELRGDTGNTSKLYPRTSEQGSVYPGIHFAGLDIPFWSSEMHTFDANYHNWYGTCNFAGITGADIVWANGYGTSYDVKFSVMLPSGYSYIY